jgi:hypothetical protein
MVGSVWDGVELDVGGEMAVGSGGMFMAGIAGWVSVCVPTLNRMGAVMVVVRLEGMLCVCVCVWMCVCVDDTYGMIPTRSGQEALVSNGLLWWWWWWWLFDRSLAAWHGWWMLWVGSDGGGESITTTTATTSAVGWMQANDLNGD